MVWGERIVFCWNFVLVFVRSHVELASFGELEQLHANLDQEIHKKTAAAGVNTTRSRTAACFSGQLRSWPYVWEVLTAELEENFGPLDYFFFVNPDSLDGTSRVTREGKLDTDPTGKSTSELRRSVGDFQHIWDALAGRLKRLVTYKFAEFEAENPLAPSPCYNAPKQSKLSHYSYHGAQLWGISKCFQEVQAYELQHNFKYDHVLRVRPDLATLSTSTPGNCHWKPRAEDLTTAALYYNFQDQFFVVNGKAVPAVAGLWRDQYTNTTVCLGGVLQSLAGPTTTDAGRIGAVPQSAKAACCNGVKQWEHGCKPYTECVLHYGITQVHAVKWRRLSCGSTLRVSREGLGLLADELPKK